MLTRTSLTDKAQAELLAFCAANLNADLDPVRYAENFDVDLGEVGGVGAVFEIPARHCRHRYVVSVSFTHDDDFVTDEMDD